MDDDDIDAEILRAQRELEALEAETIASTGNDIDEEIRRAELELQKLERMH
jgi:hypothetical protein